jgi:nickel-dependent lactate racemase
LPRDISGAPDPYSVVKQALQNPVERPGLSSAARRGPVTIITDDFTRPNPAGVICQAIIDQLSELGIDGSQITIGRWAS